MCRLGTGLVLFYKFNFGLRSQLISILQSVVLKISLHTVHIITTTVFVPSISQTLLFQPSQSLQINRRHHIKMQMLLAVCLLFPLPYAHTRRLKVLPRFLPCLVSTPSFGRDLTNCETKHLFYLMLKNSPYTALFWNSSLYACFL